MELLASLGVNPTIFWHSACFLVSYLALYFLILKPYAKALQERESRTVGNEQLAVRSLDLATALEGEFEAKARAQNSELKTIFELARRDATKEYEIRAEEARREAAEALDRSRAEISQQIQMAKSSLSAEVPAVGAAIASKLAGKEISL